MIPRAPRSPATWQTRLTDVLVGTKRRCPVQANLDGGFRNDMVREDFISRAGGHVRRMLGEGMARAEEMRPPPPPEEPFAG